jgi:hypothetical protein
MPLTDKKIISIIMEEGGSVPERFEGYREELIQTIGDIITAERGNRVEATNIQQKVNDKVDAVARLLLQSRDGTDEEVER